MIVGDLSLDVVTAISRSTALSELTAGKDVLEDTTSSLTIGGSAWLFAHALSKSDARPTPIIVAPIGPDRAGDVIRSELVDCGYDISGLLDIQQLTSVCVMLYFSEQQRLMTFPTQIAPKIESLAECARTLKHVRTNYALTCAWISGHSLVKPTPERIEAIRYICTTVRSEGGNVILDLVPHRFREAVGDTNIIGRLGRLDGIVGEFTTFADLGMVDLTMQDDERTLMIKTANQISLQHKLCIVQGKVGNNRYGQAVAQAGKLVEWTLVDVGADTLRGLGDSLAVSALLRLDIL